MYIDIKPNALNNLQRLLIFSTLNNNCFISDAVYSDETENFVSNSEPNTGEKVVISIRTAKNNVDAVRIIINDERIPMQRFKTDSYFDYFRIILPISSAISYYFLIVSGGREYYYNKRGLFFDIDRNYNFRIIPNFRTPNWAKGAVFYQIYVDRFYNGDPTNDVVDNEYLYLSKSAKKIADWNSPVANEDICNFYGGDLQGVLDKMRYLRDLGVEVIYFNPLFVSPSNHKYDAQDYDYIDPHFGVIIEDGGNPLEQDKFHNKFATMYMKRTTDKKNLEASNQLMVELIQSAHRNGIRVILDGVFNHCGAFHRWLDRENFYGQNGYPTGAYREKESIYHNYFSWYDNAWPNNECYDSWWGHDNHPKLNFENSPELYEYIMDIGAKWVSQPFNADGWRLDVAADLGSSPEFNHQFWRDFRASVKRANPDAIILAEHYDDPTTWLEGDQWDTIMNYSAFMEPISWFLTGMEKHSEEFRQDRLRNAMEFENSMRYNMSRLPIQSLLTSMNELSNHDHSRFLTRTNMTAGRLHTNGSAAAGIGINKAIMYEAVAMQMTWPGAPTIYYGDEAGMVGWTDPDNRRTFPWGNEDMDLLNFHREIIKIHRRSAALRRGSLEYLYMNYGIISYTRFLRDDRIVCAFNNNDATQTLRLPIWKSGAAADSVFISLISTSTDGFSSTNNLFTASEGYLSLTLPPYSSIILTEKI